MENKSKKPIEIIDFIIRENEDNSKLECLYNKKKIINNVSKDILLDNMGKKKDKSLLRMTTMKCLYKNNANLIDRIKKEQEEKKEKEEEQIQKEIKQMNELRNIQQQLDELYTIRTCDFGIKNYVGGFFNFIKKKLKK